MDIIKFFLVLSVFIGCATPLNILGVFPYEGKSHFLLFQPLLHELAARGHNLTVISHFPQKNPIANYNDISLAGKSKILEAVFPIERTYWTSIQVILFIARYGNENCKLMLGDKNVQNLWNTETKFDVVLVEQFNSDCALGLAHKLGAPVVGITSHLLMPWHHDRFGLYFNPSYMNYMFFGGGTKPTLYQRMERFIFNAFVKFIYKYHFQEIDQTTLTQYVGDTPPLEELAKNIKMLLLYQNFVTSGTNILPGNIKEVAGFHVTKPKELPKDLKKFIDESEHGVIYVSFGSMLHPSYTPQKMVDAIISALSELPQRVVMKWDKSKLPKDLKNIYISEWLPQNDILDNLRSSDGERHIHLKIVTTDRPITGIIIAAHKKVVAFYSHCGCLGSTEAVHYGVPVVGMPVFGDQPANAANLEESGFGVQIQVHEVTKELLLEKFKTVLDPAFRANVKQLSKAWHDQPLSSMDTAIFWLEFVGRNKNLTLRPPIVDTPSYQYYNLDILAILIAFISIFVIIFVKVSCKSTVKSNKKKHE